MFHQFVEMCSRRMRSTAAACITVTLACGSPMAAFAPLISVMQAGCSPKSTQRRHTPHPSARGGGGIGRGRARVMAMTEVDHRDAGAPSATFPRPAAANYGLGPVVARWLP